MTYGVENSGSYVSNLNQSFNFNYTKVVPTLKSSVDIVQPILISVDITSYLQSGVTPTITRDFRLQYPASARSTADVISSEDNVFSQTFFHMGLQPLQHDFKLTSEMSYDFTPDGTLNTFLVADKFIYVDNINVVNPLDDKAMYATMSNMYQCYNNYKGKDVNKQNELLEDWMEMCSYFDMIQISIRFLETDKM